MLSACGRSLYHEVRPGDTLYQIGRRYGVPYQEIARLNDLPDPNRIEVGQRLQIPRGGQEHAVAATTEPENWETPSPFPQNGESLFTWPIAEGRLTSGFGPRNGHFHEGIDIAAPRGTPVLAAADGEVIFSDVLRGYGKVVIVRHGKGYVTVYAHNQQHHVRDGQFVQRGEHLADVGQSGRVTGPNLHFEIRKDNLARNPLAYLPQDRRTVQRGSP